MKPELVNKINGFGMVLRFITPCMVGVVIVLMTHFLGEMSKMRTSLDNHLQTDVRVIGERLARIEERLGIPAK